MNRLLWGIAFLVLAAAGGWAQSTWRGQAEVWTSGSVPSTGFVAASNQFPKNSLLTIENYKTKKTVQVRVVQGLPVGSAALVLLNPRAAAALDMKAGDTPLVGVRIDPTGTDRPDNPDPDVNPLAEKPAGKAAVAEAPPVPVPAVTPVPTPAPVPAPAAGATPRVPAVNSLEVTKGATALDPDLMPLPALASPAIVAEPTPLAVADEPESPAPVTPGKMVFVTAREPSAVAAETPAVTATPEPVAEVSAEPMASPEPMADPVPLASAEPMADPLPSSEPPLPEPEPVAVSPEPVPAPSPEPVPAALPEPVAAPEPSPAVAEAPAPAPVPVVPEVPVAETPAAPVPRPVVEKPVTPPPAVPATPVAPLVVKPAPATAWVSVPGKLEGPVLGEVAVLSSLDHGRAYVQVGTWADEASLLAAMGTLRSFVPVALYRAEGEKNPWRLVVASVPKGQLGFLLMHFRSQGFRSAALVKG